MTQQNALNNFLTIRRLLGYRTIFTNKMRTILLLILSIAFNSLLPAQDVKTVSIEYLEKKINKETDTLKIINFWSTTCKPCIKELPYFDSVASLYAGLPVEVLLVSVDPINFLETRVVPFITGNKIRAATVLLNEKDPNQWIPRISMNWRGSIPATLFVHQASGFADFREQEFELNEIIIIVESIIQRP